MIKYENEPIQPPTTWRGKDLTDARSIITGSPTGMLNFNSDQAYLLAMRAGKENASEVMQAADEKMSADEAIMRGRQVVEGFWRELMMQTESVPAAQLHIAYQASQPVIIPEQAKNLAAEQGAQGTELASGFAVALVAVVRAFNNYCDEHKIGPNVRKAGLSLFTLFLIVACGMPSISGLIETAQPPLETAVVAGISTVVEGDAGNAGAQGLTPSATPKVTREPTGAPTKAPTNTPKAATATEAAATATFVIETSVPSDMKELQGKGYDEEALDGQSMHAIMREETVKYGEVKWKGKIIQAWTEVGIFIDGKPVKTIVVNQWYDPVTKHTYILESSGGITVDPIPLSLAAVKGLREGIAKFTPSSTPIVVIKFGSTGNELTDGIFAGAFPLKPFSGKASELIFIPGIGYVLPATAIEIQESMTSE